MRTRNDPRGMDKVVVSVPPEMRRWLDSEAERQGVERGRLIRGFLVKPYLMDQPAESRLYHMVSLTKLEHPSMSDETAYSTVLVTAKGQEVLRKLESEQQNLARIKASYKASYSRKKRPKVEAEP